MILLVSAINGFSEDRKYVIGTTIDVVGGGVKGLNSILPTANQRGSAFYEAYPSIQLRSSGSHSSLDLSYAYGISRINSNTSYNTDSHGITAAFTSALGEKWKLNLTDSFQRASNFTTFNATRGVVSNPESFVFNPAGYNRSTQSNNAAIGAEYTINERSTVSFSASHSLLTYDETAAFKGILSDQQRISETTTYSQKFSKTAGFTLGYTGSYTDFNGTYDNFHSHAVNAGLFHQIGHDLTIQVSGGPTYVQTVGTLGTYSAGNYKGYNAQASIQKPVKSNTLTGYYAHESGQSVGLGSISDTDRAGFGLSRPISKTMTFFTDLSAFDTRGKLGNPYSTRGVSAAANMGFSISRTLSLHWGGQYQRYDNTTIFGFEQKRVYVSLRFDSPELLKLTK